MYRRRSHRDARGPPGRGVQWLACPVLVAVHLTASMNADAVHFPKGVFPPDADFGKGGHVPMTHDGSGGCPTLWGDSFEDNYAFGIIILFFLCSRQKSTVLNVPPTLWRVPAKAKETYFSKNAFRRRSASTLLHRRWPPRRAPAKAKELFFKKRFPPTFGEYTSPPSETVHGVHPPRPKNSLYKKSSPRRLPCENRKIKLIPNPHTGICNSQTHSSPRAAAANAPNNLSATASLP